MRTPEQKIKDLENVVQILDRRTKKLEAILEDLTEMNRESGLPIIMAIQNLQLRTAKIDSMHRIKLAKSGIDLDKIFQQVIDDAEMIQDIYDQEVNADDIEPL
jgi:hypothetical protein